MRLLNCLICNKPTDFFSKGKILNKYEISYYKCSNCGFVQTESPYWLNEAYNSAITDSDIGLVSRNLELLKIVTAILKIYFPRLKKGIDFGGGYGIFTRLMRDSGYDFEWYDLYCENLFAKGFEKKLDHYDVLTAFELFEHFDNPMEQIKTLMDLGDNIICSTELLPTTTPAISEWWYYSEETGQHISFYSKETMYYIAHHFNRYYLNYKNIHVFSKKQLFPKNIKMICRSHALINYILKRESLLLKDYKYITGKTLK